MQNEKRNFSNSAKMISNLYEASAKYHIGFIQLINRKLEDVQEADVKEQIIVANSFIRSAENAYSKPEVAIDHIFTWIHNWLEICNSTMTNFIEDKAPVETTKDSRFSSELWNKNPAFHFIQSSYLMNQGWIMGLIHKLNEANSKDMHKVSFYTKQIIDAMSPSNFPFTNPDVIKQTIESNGENLVSGADNFLEDVERSQDNFSIASTDFDAFKVGENLAITKGSVVFQNDLMQLIQYESTTSKVYKKPLVIMPAWINKYYILDLQEKNSFVKWIVDQGYTVFMISWKNPTSEDASKTFSDYMVYGPLAAITKVKELTGEANVNMVGYCLGGTLLAATAGYIKAKELKSINSLTFLTTLVDFKESGDLSVFIDEEQIKLLESRMSDAGYLDGADMATTFSMLRANDMIWSFYVNNYLMGKDPFPFDILYWNADSTRLPAAMHSFYLRNMYQKNLLKKAGGITLNDIPIDLSTIDLPTYILAAKSDHIVPWKSAFGAMSLYSGDVRFVLTDSGHVAGVVNHPSKQKYCYWINEKSQSDHKSLSPSAWFKHASKYPGSWWNDWISWMNQRSDIMISASPINPKTIIEPAPGRYVK